MFDIFKTILDVAKSLLGLSDQLRSADRQRREAMSGLFSSISDCLVDVSTEIRAGRIPHGRCAEIEQYAQDLPGKIRNEVPDRADELGQLLQSAYHVEIVAMNLHQLEQDADKEPYLAQIEEAAGTFRALANLIKAG